LTFTLDDFFDVDQMLSHPWSEERDRRVHKKWKNKINKNMTRSDL
jgi:hypothetical protein